MENKPAVVALAAFVAGFGGCGRQATYHHVRHTPPPISTPAPAVTPSSSQTVTVLATVRAFGTAIVDGQGRQAAGFLTPSLASQTGSNTPAAMLGILYTPLSWSYSPDTSTTSTARVKLTFVYHGGHISNILRLVKSSNGWRISKITRTI